MTVPEHLRKNKQLMANLEANSRQLVRHYDNHATWVNIARECDKMTSDKSFDRLDTSTWNVALQGESYLYPFDLSKPRNCANLRVHPDYCICQNGVKNVTVEKQPLAKRIAHSSTVELLKLYSDVGMHRVTFRTLPNDGKYEAHVKDFEFRMALQVSNEDDVGGAEAYSIVTNKITRLDAYEAQLKCTKDYEARPFCYCRTLLRI
ncbi:Protein F10C2.3 [Aphelenchoides avenae]|nr:Protein F10C2.3 [Aphelenchus avenae]